MFHTILSGFELLEEEWLKLAYTKNMTNKIAQINNLGYVNTFAAFYVGLLAHRHEFNLDGTDKKSLQ